MTRLAGALAIAVLGALMVFSVAAAQGTPTSITIPIKAQNNSGESGTATLTANGSQTTVVVNLTGAPNNPQPAHIHPGTCATLDPNPKYPLTSLQGGQSTSSVPVTLESLVNGTYAINVHKSAQEVSVYFACGDITLAAAQLAPQTGHAQGTALLPAAALVLLAGGLLGGGILLRRRATA